MYLYLQQINGVSKMIFSFGEKIEKSSSEMSENSNSEKRS